MVDSIVMQLVSRVLDSGCTPEEACCGSPELITEVRAQLRRIQSIDLQVDELFPRTESELLAAAEPSCSDERLPDIPGHKVLRVLGHGGMGIVYEARHVRLNRSVAVKTLLGGAHTDPVHLKRFLREAEAVAALRHPNIVQVHEVGDDEGLPYFTMELVEGGSLREKLQEGPLDAREAATLVATLAEAMEVAHANGIVHRDLKPANVLLTRDGVPKIADFGLARRIESESSLTLSDARLGTPSYMAPEQALGGANAVGPAADVYALGAILYATLTGRPPFRHDVGALTLRQVIEEEPERPSRRNPRVPRDLETICLECLTKDPLGRYATAGALAADLQRFLRGEPIVARPVGFLERSGKWVRRRPAHATIAAGAFLALLAVIGAAVWLGLERSALERAAREDLQELDREAAAANWSGARTALERARARLAGGGSAELSAQVEQGARELDVVETLETIRLHRTDVDYKSTKRTSNSAAAVAYEKAFSDLGFADVPGRPRDAAARIRSSRIRHALVSALDTWATCVTDDEARRDGLLEAVRLADPDPTGWRDRVRDAATWDDAHALAELTSTAAVSEQSVMLLLALAEHVLIAGGDAVPFLERIQQQYPDDFWSNFTLGLRLGERSDEAAVRYFQAAVAVRPDSTMARANLGAALGSTGRVEEAFVHLRKAVLMEPPFVRAHISLSTYYQSKGQLTEAVDELEAAIRLDPALVDTANRCHLAAWLVQLGRLDEAIAVCREALELDPRSYDVHVRLGYALHGSGLFEDAVEVYRRAIAIDSRAEAHESLSVALAESGRMDAAIAGLREAIRLDPRRSSARSALVQSLIERDRFEEARTEARSFLDSLPARDPMRPQAEALLGGCELSLALAADIPAIRDGTRAPRDGAESLAFAELFLVKQDYATAARYFADALDGGIEPGDRTRFDAARCAALASAGREDESDTLGAEERAGWRALALTWLREELAAFDVRLASGAPRSGLDVQWRLMRLKSDLDLAAVREGPHLEQLPEEERAQWRALWSDVDALSARARSTR